MREFIYKGESFGFHGGKVCDSILTGKSGRELTPETPKIGYLSGNNGRMSAKLPADEMRLAYDVRGLLRGILAMGALPFVLVGLGVAPKKTILTLRRCAVSALKVFYPLLGSVALIVFREDIVQQVPLYGLDTHGLTSSP
jgi:hypothetical protein